MWNYEGTDFQTIVNARALNNTAIYEQNETHAYISFGLINFNTFTPVLPDEMEGYLEWRVYRITRSPLDAIADESALHLCTDEDLKTY